MAENPVEKRDLVKDGAILGIKSELDETIKSLDKFDDKLKSIAKTFSGDLKKAQSDTLKGINELNKAEIQSQKLLQEKIRTEQTSIKLSVQQEKLVQAEIRSKSALSRETERLAKIKEREAKATIKNRKAVIDSLNPYKRLTKQVNTAQARLKRLSVQYGETDKRTVRARKNFERLDNQLRKVNNDARDGRRDVGRYGLATEKMGNSVRKVTSLLGQFGLALGGAAIVRNAIGVLTEFDEKVADVAKTTGLTIEKSRELSLELLKIDTRTAIGQLQELASAAGRLGIQVTANIIAFTETADRVFVALGDDLGGTAEEIATNLGKVSNNFGLLEEFGVAGGIERIGSSMNELSASGASSAGAILDFTNRMAGLSDVLEVSDVQALGALFDESGQSVEVASSTLSKLLPSLASEFEKFAEVAGLAPEEFKKIAEEAPIEALKLVAEGAKNNEKGLFSLTKTLESYGVTSSRAAGIVGTLTNKTDRLTELQQISTKAIEENISVTEEFAKKNDTLAANYEKLKNELTAYILGTDGATGASEKLKNAAKFLTKNLVTIIRVLGKLLKVYVAYKVVTSELVKGTKAFGAELIKNNGNIKKTAEGLKVASKNMEAGAKSAKGLGAALKSVGWAVAVTLVLELGAALIDAASGAKLFREQLQAFNEFQRRIDKDVDNRIKAEKERLKLLLARIDANKKLTESEKLTAKTEATKKATDAVTDQIRVLRERRNILLSGLDAFNKTEKANGRLTVKQEAGRREQRRMINALAENIVTWKDFREGLQSSTVAFVESNDEISNGLRTVKAINKEIAEINKQLLLTTARSEARPLQARIKELELEREAILGSKKKEKANKKEKRSVIDLTSELERQLEVEKEIQEGRDTFNIENLQADADKELAIAVNLAEKTGQVNTDLFDLRLNQEKALRRAIIERQFLESIDAATSDVDVRLAQENRIRDLSRLDDEFISRRKDGLEELNDAQEGYAEKQRKREETEIEEQEDFLKTFIQIEKAITDALEEQIDKRILAKEKERDAAIKESDFLRQLAAEGNDEAKDSLAEQRRLEIEAQKEIDALERKKANLKLISAAISTFANQIDGGATPADALAQTVFSTTALTAFLSGLNFFEKGTMNAPEGVAVVDEKGAELITDRKGNIKALGTGSGARMTHLESGDKVYTASQTTNVMAGLNNANQLSKMNMGNINNSGGSVDTSKLEGQISNLTKVVKNKPELNIEAGQIIQGAMSIVESKTQGGIRTVNTYIVKSQ